MRTAPLGVDGAEGLGAILALSIFHLNTSHNGYIMLSGSFPVHLSWRCFKSACEHGVYR